MEAQLEQKLMVITAYLAPALILLQRGILRNYIGRTFLLKPVIRIVSSQMPVFTVFEQVVLYPFGVIKITGC